MKIFYIFIKTEKKIEKNYILFEKKNLIFVLNVKGEKKANIVDIFLK